MSRDRLILWSGTVLALFLGAGILWHVVGSEGETVDFNRDIRPILNENCVTCHGGVRSEAELSLLFREDALRPAESGKRAIVPGDPRGSELMRRVRHPDEDERMPLKAPALSDRDVAMLREWISEGAEWEPHWAYVAPRMPGLPEVRNADWPQNGIDHFVLARLEGEGLSPSPPADCARLVRRLSLDLVGLPPTPDQADLFCGNADAYEMLVDSLLASPRFGERWAALWLDLARYADSNGYETDNPREIWKFRDWVIRAFNDDMPFDQFTIEQIAGDLLSEPTDEQLIATAFHRNTMTNTEGGTDDEEFRVAAVIDRVNTTFEVWQGTTISCAQCHGHPYDPFRQEEFYRLYAFFNNTADADRFDNEPKAYHFADAVRADGERILNVLRETEPQMDPAEWDEWLADLEAYAADDARPPTFEEHLVSPPLLRIAKRSNRSPNDVHQLREFFAATRRPGLAEHRKELRERLSALQPETTPVMEELPPDRRRDTYVFDRGNWLARGERVEPDVPNSLPALSEDAPRDRLGLAQWLVDSENPLTARVTVNRLWEQLFGFGLAETVEDFGTQGDPPSHPELLDWMALRFAGEHGWSIKRALKEMVMSATYRQTSRTTPELLERDPRNRLLARGPRFRLSAEQIRDQALAVGGLLSNKMYGPSVFPVQPEGLWRNPYSSLKWETSEGADRHRRALYTFWRRTVPYPSMLAFDAMSREMCTSRRIRTNTPLQALVTLNDPVFVEAAGALAVRMVEEGGSTVDGRIRAGYRRALLVDPPSETLETLRQLYESALGDFRAEPERVNALFENASRVARGGEYVNLGSEAAAETGSDGAAARSSKAAAETSSKAAAETSSKANGVTSSGMDAATGFVAGSEARYETAALAVVANAIMNLDSFLTKE